MAAKTGQSPGMRGLDRKPAKGLPPMLYRVRLRGSRERAEGAQLGKQPPASADAARPALTTTLANPLDMLGLTDPAAEGGLEFLGQLQPCRSGDADALQDRWQILGDRPALVVAHHPSGPVDQLQVVGEVEGQPSGWRCRVRLPERCRRRSPQPVFHHQCLYPAKLQDVVGHQHTAQCPGLGSDPQSVGSDQRPFALHVRPDSPIVKAGIAVHKGERDVFHQTRQP